MTEIKKPRFISLVGYPAVGKSTYAEELRHEGFTVISGDEAIRRVMEREGIASMEDCYATHKQEIDTIMDKELSAALTRGDNIVYDVLNTSIKRRARSLSIVKQADIAYHCEAVIIFPPEAEVHADRLVKRAIYDNRPSAGDGLYLTRLENEYQAPSIAEGYDEIKCVGVPPQQPLMSM